MQRGDCRRSCRMRRRLLHDTDGIVTMSAPSRFRTMISDSGLQSPAAPVIDQELGGRAPMTGRAVLAPGVPLCVDLDGTLVKSDTLVDSVLALARQKPAEILRIPSWIAQGKAQFKKHVTASVTLDVEHLPYNRPLLEWLRAEHGAGRAIYLATAADRSLAERVADYLGIFAGVLASDGDDESRGEEQAGGVSRTLRRAVLLHRQCETGCGAAVRLRESDDGEPAPRVDARDCVAQERCRRRTLRTAARR